ncbi:MAG: hypothetical protein WCW56_00255 [Candidatus Paceibacterota bacterium]|jgi:hypothetical protein
MATEGFNFDTLGREGEIPENARQAEREFTETYSDSREKNRQHDLLWRVIANKKVDNILDIPTEQLPELYAAARLFSQPANFKELTGGAESWQVTRAERLISQLLRDAELAEKRGAAA